MTPTDVLITEDKRHWRVSTANATESFDQGLSEPQLAIEVTQWLRSIGAANAACVIAPASQSCFFVSLGSRDGIDIRDRKGMAFELEDHLPIDAESFVADFAVTDDNGTKNVAAIAIEHDRFKRLADGLEAEGLPVRAIVPTAILAARAIVQSVQSIGRVRLLMIDGDRIDSVEIRGGCVNAWKHIPLNSADVVRHIKLDIAADDRVIAVGEDSEARQMIADPLGEVEAIEKSMTDLAQVGAEIYLADRGGPWFDLRRDQLAATDPLRAVQRNLRWLAIAASLFFTTLAIGGWYRASRIDREVTAIVEQQQSLFEKAFPGTRIPGAVLKRVRSEHARMLGSRGGTTSIDVPVPAPTVLRAVLSSLSADVRFRIDALQINDGQVDLDLQVRSPVDAGKIAKALSAAGFEVDPPVTTQKDAKTFISTIEAKWNASNREAL